MPLSKVVYSSWLIVSRKYITTNNEPLTTNPRSKGFTLIELLVVISIIGLLIGVATVSYSNVQMKGRDGKRKADLAAISQALARFYDDNGAYPMQWPSHKTHDAGKLYLTCKTSTQPISTDKIDWGTPFTCSGKTYMAKLPDDPNYPGQVKTDPDDHGYVYKIYEWKYMGADGSTEQFPNAPKGWCSAAGMDGSVQLVNKCQHFTLWTTLENEKDPDIDKTLSDPICKLAARYGGIGNNPENMSGPGHPVPAELEWWGDPNSVNYWRDYWWRGQTPQIATQGWSYWAKEDPDNPSADPPSTKNFTSGSRNYCIHD